MSKTTDFAYYLTKYLSDYLPGTIGASPNTVASYKREFSFFLYYKPYSTALFGGRPRWRLGFCLEI